SELADNAQYWIGEIFYAQKKLPEAAAEFEKVAIVNARGDKTASALYKRGLILLEIQKKDEAIAQFQMVVKDFPKTREADLAMQQLQQLAPESLVAPPTVSAPQTPIRKPKKP